MFRILKYVEGSTPFEQSKNRMKAMRKDINNPDTVQNYIHQIQVSIKDRDLGALRDTLERMYMEELTLEDAESLILSGTNVYEFMDDYKQFGVLGFIRCV